MSDETLQRIFSGCMHTSAVAGRGPGPFAVPLPAAGDGRPLSLLEMHAVGNSGETSMLQVCPPHILEQIIGMLDEPGAAALRQSSRMMYAVSVGDERAWQRRLRRHFGLEPDEAGALCRRILQEEPEAAGLDPTMGAYAQHTLFARALRFKLVQADARQMRVDLSCPVTAALFAAMARTGRLEVENLEIFGSSTDWAFVPLQRVRRIKVLCVGAGHNVDMQGAGVDDVWPDDVADLAYLLFDGTPSSLWCAERLVMWLPALLQRIASTVVHMTLEHIFDWTMMGTTNQEMSDVRMGTAWLQARLGDVLGRTAFPRLQKAVFIDGHLAQNSDLSVALTRQAPCLRSLVYKRSHSAYVRVQAAEMRQRQAFGGQRCRGVLVALDQPPAGDAEEAMLRWLDRFAGIGGFVHVAEPISQQSAALWFWVRAIAALAQLHRCGPKRGADTVVSLDSPQQGAAVSGMLICDGATATARIQAFGTPLVTVGRLVPGAAEIPVERCSLDTGSHTHAIDGECEWCQTVLEPLQNYAFSHVFAPASCGEGQWSWFPAAAMPAGG